MKLQIKNEEIPIEEAIFLLDISIEEIQILISKNAIPYRKSGDNIFISRKEVDTRAEKLLARRLEGLGKLIEMQQEMGLYK